MRGLADNGPRYCHFGPQRNPVARVGGRDELLARSRLKCLQRGMNHNLSEKIFECTSPVAPCLAVQHACLMQFRTKVLQTCMVAKGTISAMTRALTQTAGSVSGVSLLDEDPL